MAFASIDLTTGKATITQAGHPEPVVIRANGEIEFIGKGGFPVGLIEDAEYDQFETQLYENDRLLFCSDGVTEAMLSDGTVLNQSGLRELLISQLNLKGKDFLDGLYARLMEQLPKGGALDDDVSAIMVEFRSTQS